MKSIKIILALFFVILFLASCAKKPMEEAEEKSGELTGEVQETAQTDISGDISEVNTLEEDLDMSELENLEKDLDAIDWE